MLSKDTLFPQNYTLNCRGRLVDLSLPTVMAILNLTPDSFYGGSRILGWSVQEIVDRAGQALAEGAFWLDLGACSTRPGAPQPEVGEELDRLLPALEAIRKAFPEALLSVDTYRSEVVRATHQLGIDLINDISGGTLDPKMWTAVAETKLPYVLMHMRGTPATMQNFADYDDLVNDIYGELVRKVFALRELGVVDIVLDLGFGFAKTVPQNFELLRRLQEFTPMGLPLLVGLSRKSMIYRTLGVSADDALNGSSVVHAWALERGAKILRVHDVKPAVEAIQLWKRLENI